MLMEDTVHHREEGASITLVQKDPHSLIHLEYDSL
jgi:hypothetical protein